MRVRRSVAAALVLLVVALLGACGTSAPAASAATITVTLTDKEIVLSDKTVNAGTFTFNVINKGTTMHSLVLLRTDLPHDKIPADANDAAKVQETGAIAATGQLAVGASKQLARQLAPGNYVLVCNEPAHYAVGMHTALVVK